MKSDSASGNNKTKRYLRAAVFAALLMWCAGFSIAPLFPDSPVTAVLYPVLKRDYGIVCHQRDVKTFAVFGHKLLVCARCTGIYFGALIISFVSLFIIKKIILDLKLLYAAMIPMALDVLLTTFGVYQYSKYLAFLTGLFFGSVVFIYILAAFENNFLDDKHF